MVNPRSRNKLIALFFVGVCTSVFAGGFVHSNLKTGMYMLDSPDSEDKLIYQYESAQISGEAGATDFALAFKYSDLYQSRPNTYANSHRLSMAKVGYSPMLNRLRLQVGRDYQTLIDRNVLYDGGLISYKTKKSFGLNLFSGFSIPNFYQEDLFDFNSDNWVFGYVSYLNLKSGAKVYTDGTINTESENTYGLGASQHFNRKVFIDANGVFDQGASAISHAEASVKIRTRQHDRLQFLVSFEDDDIDSTQYYTFLYQEQNIMLAAAYLWTFHPQGFFSIHQGLLTFDDFLGYISKLQVGFHGVSLSASQKIESEVSSFDQSIGFSYPVLKWLKLSVGSGFLLYQLKNTEDTQTAIFSEAGIKAKLPYHFQFITEYQYLSNEYYESDNRLFIGLTYKGYQRF